MNADFDLSIPSEFLELPSKQICSGVYILKDAAGLVLYVGQSHNICHRVDTHRRTKSWGKQIAEVVWVPQVNPEQRLITETLLIFKLRPAHNRWIKLGLKKGAVPYEATWAK